MGTAPAVTHVVFDMDGLLLDTEKIYTEVTQEIAEPFGKKYGWHIKQKVMGKPSLEAARIIVEELGLPMTVEEYLSRRETLQTAKFRACEVMPGVMRLVSHLQAHSIPMAVATSSNTAMFDVKTANHGELFAHFSHIIRGDDPAVVRGKPDPLIFQLACERFDSPPLGPDRVLVFEDAPSGVEAAKAAGMHVVWVRNPNLDPSLCSPTETIHSISEFRPEQYGLPPYA